MSATTKRKLLLDSGASYHMISVHELSKEELDTRRDLDRAIPLQIADGIIWVSECVEIWIHELAVRVTAVLSYSKNCPCVLSLGKLVDETRLTFKWDPGTAPTLYKGSLENDDVAVHCNTHRDCPFLCTTISADDEEPHEEARALYTRITTDQMTPITPISGNPGGEASSSSDVWTPTVISSPLPMAKAKAKRKAKAKAILAKPKPTDDILAEEVMWSKDDWHPPEPSIPPELLQDYSVPSDFVPSTPPELLHPPPPLADPKIEKMIKERIKQRTEKRRSNNKVRMSKTFAFHNCFIHFPKDPDCPICTKCKPMSARRGDSKKACDSLPTPKKFGDRGTLDHKIINEDDKSRDGDRNICVILNEATYWLQAYADARKTAEATIRALQEFYGPEIREISKHIYSDNSGEIESACKYLMLPHDTSVPHVPQTNGIAENAVKKTKECTACTLEQSGFADAHWKEAMNCFCFLKNVVDILWTNMTAYKMRFGEDFRGPVIPFGAEIQYYPTSEDDKGRLHQMGDKLLTGLFGGYKQQSGGGWSEVLYVYDWDEVNESTRSQQDKYTRRKPKMTNSFFH